MTPRPFNHLESVAHARGYRVSSDGLLVTNPRGKVLKGSIGSTGYHGVNIFKNSGRVRTHRLQAFQMFGDAIYQDGIVVRHLDGNALNNSVSNIAIGTALDNWHDVPKEVRKQWDEKAAVNRREYPHVDVCEFYEISGRSYRKTMARFGIKSKGTLWNILNKSRSRASASRPTPTEKAAA